jgi:hypothetical protein
MQLKVISETYPAPGGIYLSEFGITEPVSSFIAQMLVMSFFRVQFESLRTDLYTITWDERRANYYLGEVFV